MIPFQTGERVLIDGITAAEIVSRYPTGKYAVEDAEGNQWIVSPVQVTAR
jgi:hypothetical protein